VQPRGETDQRKRQMKQALLIFLIMISPASDDQNVHDLDPLNVKLE
jgi:hypothetical protein